MDVPQSKDIKKGKIPSQTVSIIKKCSRDKKKKRSNQIRNSIDLLNFSAILLNFYASAALISLKEVGTYRESGSLEKVNLPASCFSNSLLLLCFLLFPVYLIPRRGFDFSLEFTRFFTPFSSFIDESAGFSEKQEHRFRFIFLVSRQRSSRANTLEKSN